MAAASRISAPETPTAIREHVDEKRGQLTLERRGDADERRLEPLVAERGLAVLGRERRRGRSPRSARSRARRARSRRTASAAASGPARAPPRRDWRPSRARCTRASRAEGRRRGRPSPGRSRSRDPLAERLGREQEARRRARRAAPWTTRSSTATASEPDVQARAAHEPHACDRRDHDAADDGVPRLVAERGHGERRGEVVRARRARTAPSRSGSRGRAPSPSRSRRGR